MKNWRQTVISQYDNSPRLLALIRGEDAEIDPAPEILNFYSVVFDPRTAVGWGLDCWGRIVGVGRTIALEGTPKAFGFKGSGLQPFGQGTFYSANATTTYRLGDAASVTAACGTSMTSWPGCLKTGAAPGSSIPAPCASVSALTSI